MSINVNANINGPGSIRLDDNPIIDGGVIPKKKIPVELPPTVQGIFFEGSGVIPRLPGPKVDRMDFLNNFNGGQDAALKEYKGAGSLGGAAKIDFTGLPSLGAAMMLFSVEFAGEMRKQTAERRIIETNMVVEQLEGQADAIITKAAIQMAIGVASGALSIAQGVASTAIVAKGAKTPEAGKTPGADADMVDLDVQSTSVKPAATQAADAPDGVIKNADGELVGIDNPFVEVPAPSQAKAKPEGVPLKDGWVHVDPKAEGAAAPSKVKNPKLDIDIDNPIATAPAAPAAKPVDAPEQPVQAAPPPADAPDAEAPIAVDRPEVPLEGAPPQSAVAAPEGNPVNAEDGGVPAPEVNPAAPNADGPEQPATGAAEKSAAQLEAETNLNAARTAKVNLKAQNLNTVMAAIIKGVDVTGSGHGAIMDSQGKQIDADIELMRNMIRSQESLETALKELLTKSISTFEAMAESLNQTRTKIMG